MEIGDAVWIKNDDVFLRGERDDHLWTPVKVTAKVKYRLLRTLQAYPYHLTCCS